MPTTVVETSTNDTRTTTYVSSSTMTGTYSQANGHKNLGALREIPGFEPDKEGGVNVGEFVEAVENVAKLGNLDNDDLMRVMPMRLQGAARGFYRTFLASKPVSLDGSGLGYLWKDFKQGLKDRFRRTTDSVAHLMQLTNIQQGDTETVRSYAQRVKTLAYKTWPQFTQSQDATTRRLGDTLIYQHFLKGLKPQNIERVHLKGIRDLDMAVLELTNKETFDDLQRTGGRAYKVNNISTAEPSGADELRGVVQDLKETVSAHMAETAELLRAHALAMQPTPAPHAEPGPYPAHGGAYMGQPSVIGGGHTGYGPYGQCPPGMPLTSGMPMAGYGTSGMPLTSGVPMADYGQQEAGPVEWEQSVNAVGYQPRLPQFPILRPGAPRVPASAPLRSSLPGRAPVAC